MSIHKIHSEVVDIQGIFTIALYVHYFIPGSLKINTKLYKVPLGHLRDLIEDPAADPLRFEVTRRWLPKGELPYPGYCRAPGSAQCVPTLCNCEKLKDHWNKLIKKNIAEKAKKEKKKSN